jgi:mannose-6-phosphate isomerase-like protein (cupin superfamily)
VTTDTETLKPLALAAGEGTPMWVLGNLITIKITGDQTGGEFSLWDQATPPQGGPPPHIQWNEHETFYIIEGQFEFLKGDEVVQAGPGTTVFVPRGTVHTFKNVGTGSGRLVGMSSPAGHEQFFLEAGEPAPDPDAQPEITDEAIRKVLEVAPKYGIEFPPPPEG